MVQAEHMIAALLEWEETLPRVENLFPTGMFPEMEATAYRDKVRALLMPDVEQIWLGKGPWEDHLRSCLASGRCPGNYCRAYPEPSDTHPLCAACEQRYGQLSSHQSKPTATGHLIRAAQLTDQVGDELEKAQNTISRHGVRGTGR